eukprot:7733010-Ditylum_brightwellii.AAC.1
MAKNTEDNQIHRFGQGATDALPNWTLVATIFQKTYGKFAKECTVIDPTGTLSLKSNGKMFVDDKKLVHNGKAVDMLSKTLMSIATHNVSL